MKMLANMLSFTRCTLISFNNQCIVLWQPSEYSQTSIYRSPLLTALCAVVLRMAVNWKHWDILKLVTVTWSDANMSLTQMNISEHFPQKQCAVPANHLRPSFNKLSCRCDICSFELTFQYYWRLLEISSLASPTLFILAHSVLFHLSFSLTISTMRLRWSRGSVLAFSTQIRGFKPGRSRRNFRAKKYSQHAFLPRGSKAVGPMS